MSEPTIAKPPAEWEVAALCDIGGMVARRLAFQRDRLVSAIDGPDGWREEVAKLKQRIAELEDEIRRIEQAKNCRW